MGATPAPQTPFHRNLRILLWTLPAGLLLAGLYLAARAIPVGNTRAYTLQLVSQAAADLRLRLDKYDNISVQFVANRDLNKLLVDYVQAKDNYEVSLQNQGFTHYFEGYAFHDEGIYDALFIDEANPERKALTMGEALPNRFIKAFPNSEFYRAVVAADGRPVWSGGVQVGPPGNETAAVGRRIKHLFTGHPLGVLVIFLRQEHLARLAGEYLKANFYFSLGTLRANYVMLVDGDDRIISAVLPGNLGKKVTKVLQHVGPFSSAFLRQSEKGSFTAQVGKDKVLVAFQKVKGTDWKLLVPVSSALVGGASRALLPLAGLVVFAGTVLGAGLWLARHQPQVAPLQPPAREELELLAALNEREREILRLLAQGLSNKEIAATIFVAEQTVKNYVSSIYQKLGVHDRVQAARKAVRAGLLRDST